MEERNLRKTRVGIVVSDKMDKTIVVAVKDSVQHPLYKKILSVPPSSRLVTSRTSAASVTVLRSWSAAPCPRMCAGAWSVSLRRQSNLPAALNSLKGDI